MTPQTEQYIKKQLPEPSLQQEAQPPEPQTQAALWAAETAQAIADAPSDYARHAQVLYDLKKNLVDYCAAPYGYRGIKNDDLRWDLARHMPAFSTESLYQKRSSWFSLGGVILTGYLLGGALATVLDWLSLGGEIIRVATIWGMCWLSEYLASHPRARTRILGLLGLGALGKFSLDLLGGMLSLSSWTSIRGAIFGGLSAFNPFKRLYLLLGAAVLFVLLSKKVTSVDAAAFRDDLEKQLQARIQLLQNFFERLATLEDRLARLEGTDTAKRDPVKCPRNDCLLALDLIDMLETLAPDARRFLAEKLALVGYDTALAKGEDTDILIWNSAEHDRLYDMVGLVRDGDTCHILKPWCMSEDKIIKGYVQRDTGGAR